MGLEYLLAFSVNVVIHSCSCKNRISENFAGFSKIFNMCFFTVYSCEAGDLLPHQADFFFLIFFVHPGMLEQGCSRVLGNLL